MRTGVRQEAMNGSAIRGRIRAWGRRRPGFSVETDTRTTSKPEAALQERTEARALRCFGHRNSSRPSALLQGRRACERSARKVLDRGHAAQSPRQPAQQREEVVAQRRVVGVNHTMVEE